MDFNEWLSTFLEEKEIDAESITFEVEGPEWGANIIPMVTVIEHMRITSPTEQQAIKAMLIKIDFANAPVVPYFKHLAQAIAR